MAHFIQERCKSANPHTVPFIRRTNAYRCDDQVRGESVLFVNFRREGASAQDLERSQDLSKTPAGREVVMSARVD